MKKLTALGVGLTLVHAAWASTYVRPQVAYLMPEESGAKSTVGAFVALGYSPAAHGEHELEIELGWADWDYEESATIDDFSFVGKAGYKILPVMLNYRFNTKLVEKTAATSSSAAGSPTCLPTGMSPWRTARTPSPSSATTPTAWRHSPWAPA